MQAITSAAHFLGGKYLKNCSLYVTLEPCQMCAGALYWSQLSKVVYGASDEQRGFVKMGTQLHPKTQVISGILANEAAELIKRFFAQRRK
jgi:tRNA(adenine34) deaminase